MGLYFNSFRAVIVFISQMYKDGPRAERVNPYNTGIDFGHQNLTSEDTVKVKIFIVAVEP